MAGIAIVAVEPFAFLGSFAGDAQVHLVFAENASHGRFFEFNRGERVSGETSPGYMLIGAALFRALPPPYVPVALKLIGLVAWYILCWTVYRVARRSVFDAAHHDSTWSVAAAVVAAVLPGSVYNANVGMENGVFAAGVWWWIDRAEGCGWFRESSSEEGPRPRSLALAAALGLLCWLRPEGFLVLLLALGARVRHAPTRVGRALAEFTCAILVGASVIVFQHAITGDWIATSILSRRLAALRESVIVGPLALDPTFAKRLLLYAPLTALFVVGARSFTLPQARFLVHLGAGAFVFYTVAGGPHLARYVIFVMPVLAVGAVAGARLLWKSKHRTGRVAVVGALCVFVTSCIAETLFRRRQYSQGLLMLAIQAPERRTKRSEAVLAKAAASTAHPLVMATEAIQQRYELDSRIIVRSVDGRTDRSLFRFVNGADVDEAAYLGFVGAELLDGIGFPDAGRAESLGDQLRRAPVGGTLRVAGLSFARLDPFTYRISTAPWP